jgi:hypothetical protein
MEEAPENGKESPHSARAKVMNEIWLQGMTKHKKGLKKARKFLADIQPNVMGKYAFWRVVLNGQYYMRYTSMMQPHTVRYKSQTTYLMNCLGGSWKDATSAVLLAVAAFSCFHITCHVLTCYMIFLHRKALAVLMTSSPVLRPHNNFRQLIFMTSLMHYSRQLFCSKSWITTSCLKLCDYTTWHQNRF